MTDKKTPPNLALALRNEVLCKSFFCHLKDSQREKHLTFWLEAEDYKNNSTERDPTKIFTCFFSEESPNYLNMETDEKLMEKVQNNTQDCFEHAQHSSFLYLSGIFETSFLESDIYREYVAESEEQK